MGSFYTNTNGVPLEDGRVHHLGLARGEVANRFILVGSDSRARLLRGLLDGGTSPFALTSNRGFTTYTGAYRGVPVTVCATGMGGPMMDFAVRELRTVAEGPVLMVRLGSCGGVSTVAKPGVVVANTPGSVRISRHVDASFGDDGDFQSRYVVSQKVAAPDALLAAAVASELRKEVGEEHVLEALNCSADSFYDAQGRVDPNFRDDNEALLDELRTAHAGLGSMEMETFYLLHLASHAVGVRAAACAVVAANRLSGAVVDKAEFQARELASGRAVLNAVTSLNP